MRSALAEDWSRILERVGGRLSEEEKTIARARADGKTMREIGRMLGQHRSMIWRKSKRIRALAEP
jgi:IS30 family transposase